MATLETVSGASFVPDLTAAFKAGAAGMEKLREKTIIEELSAPDISQDQFDKIRLQLASINPKTSQGIEQILKSNDQRAKAELLKNATEASQFLQSLSVFKNTELKRSKIREKSRELQADGRLEEAIDLQEMLSLEGDQLNLEIQRKLIMSSGAKQLGDIQKSIDTKRANEQEQFVNELRTIQNAPIEQQSQILVTLLNREANEGRGQGRKAKILRELQGTTPSPGVPFNRDIKIKSLLAGQPPAKPVAVPVTTRLVDPVTGEEIVPAVVKPEKPTDNFVTLFDDKGNVIAQRNERTGEVKKDPRAAGADGLGGLKKFSKGQGFLLSDSKGNKFTVTSVLDQTTGEIKNKVTPVAPGEFISRLGETAGAQQQRAIETAGGKRQAILDVDLKMLPRVEGAKISTEQRLEASFDFFNKLPTLNEKIGLYDQAIDAVRRGAGTGPVEDLMPTFRAATFELQNIQQQLGLNILSGVTMGSLSENEMSILLSTAIPTGLDEPELMAWLETRKQATIKLRDFTEDAATFLRNPNNTLEGFIAKQRRDRAAEKATPTPTTGGGTKLTPEQEKRLDFLRKKQQVK